MLPDCLAELAQYGHTNLYDDEVLKVANFEARAVQMQRTLHWRSKKEGGGHYFDKPKTQKSCRVLLLPFAIGGGLEETPSGLG